MVERYKYFGDLTSAIAGQFAGFERQTINRVFGISDTPPPPSVLTIDKLQSLERMVGALRCFMVVHADDAGRQVVKDFVAAGYELRFDPIMPVGFGYLQSPETCAHLDFEKGTAMTWESTLTTFEVPGPAWGPSAIERLRWGATNLRLPWRFDGA
jgi:hypothetical protein